MKPETIKVCDPKLLDRYRDGELSDTQRLSVKSHLIRCQSCRDQIENRNRIAEAVRTDIDHVLSGANLDQIEDKIIRRIRKARLRKPSPYQRFFLSKPFLMPASVFTAAILIFFFIYNPISPEPVPSALINSFTGRISSAMIIETPETHHTILWFSEDSTMAGEENAAHQT